MTKFCVTSWDAIGVGTQICEALGVESNSVRRIIIDLEVGAVAKVYLETLADIEALSVKLPDPELKIVEAAA